jgi:hypothetical protein
MRLGYAAAGVCLVAAIAAVGFVLVGHGQSTAPHSVPSTPSPSPIPSASVSGRQARIDGEFPVTVLATRMAPTYVRLPVAGGDLNNLVRVHGKVIVALADKGAFFGEVYAAISTDGGGGWRIDSPQFAHAGACGPCTTNHLNVTSDGTVFAWGNGGNLVKVTTDLGRHWYQTVFPAGVKSTTTAGRRLVVRALGDETATGRFFTRRYVSADNGMIWHRGRALPTVKS